MNYDFFSNQNSNFVFNLKFMSGFPQTAEMFSTRLMMISTQNFNFANE